MTKEELEERLDLLQQLASNEKDYLSWLKIQAEIIRIETQLVETEK